MRSAIRHHSEPDELVTMLALVAIILILVGLSLPVHHDQIAWALLGLAVIFAAVAIARNAWRSRR